MTDQGSVSLWRRLPEGDREVYAQTFQLSDTLTLERVRQESEAILAAARADGLTVYLIGGQTPGQPIRFNDLRQFDPRKLSPIGVIEPGQFDPLLHYLV